MFCVNAYSWYVWVMPRMRELPQLILHVEKSSYFYSAVICKTFPLLEVDVEFFSFLNLDPLRLTKKWMVSRSLLKTLVTSLVLMQMTDV